MAAIARCNSCGRMIYWTISPTGARLPLDARPLTLYRLEEKGTELHAVKVIEDLDAQPVYTSHFITCPNARQHSHAGAAK